MFLLGDISPEDVPIGEALLGVLWQIIASKGDASIDTRLLAQVDAEHGLQLVFCAELVNLSNLLDEGLQILLRAHRCQPNDAREEVLCHARGLVSLQDLNILDARRLLPILKADVGLSEVAIDVA